ncbi:hypothetical protein NT6N_24450 [Oceaniferula spumae]|uniref:Uncharacterized protein n=1 Tax=Oceaniferula spumae TaxID=2979115 RepID=A0AAT9FN12_9BACT
MKTIITLIVGLTLSGVSSADPTSKPAPTKREIKKLDKLPNVKVVSEDDKAVQIKITNDTGIDLSYSGYSALNPWLNASHFDGNKWVAGQGHWCGTGVSTYVLKNNESIIIKIGARDNTRYFTTFFDSKTKRYGVVILHEKKSG